MSNIIGLNQRIPINVMEEAIKAMLAGAYSREWAMQHLEREISGANRIAKAVNELNSAVINNPQKKYIMDNGEKILEAMQYKPDKTLILVGLINSSFPIGYHTTSVMGKYFHVQELVSKALIAEKIGAMYAYNKSLDNALYRVLPMFIEAGLISRPQKGVYSKNTLEPHTAESVDVYRKSFFINNPNVRKDYPLEDSPYWEFLQG